MTDHEFQEQVADFVKSPLYERLIENLVAHCVERWKNSQTVAEREEAYRLLGAVQGLKTEIISVSADARIRQHNTRRLSGPNL